MQVSNFSYFPELQIAQSQGFIEDVNFVDGMIQVYSKPGVLYSISDVNIETVCNVLINATLYRIAAKDGSWYGTAVEYHECR